MMDIRNPVFTADGLINCEILHPDYGWVPFTATPDDPEPHGRETFAAAMLMDVAPYVPPPEIVLTPEEQLAAMPPVSHAQMIAALIFSEIITREEGVEWIKGNLPAAVQAMIAALPPEEAVIAELRAIRPTSVVPTDPLVAALAAAQGKTEEDLMAIFALAASM